VKKLKQLALPQPKANTLNLPLGIGPTGPQSGRHISAALSPRGNAARSAQSLPATSSPFEEVVEQVARTIAEKVKSVKSEEADDVSKHLANLASAARSGKRQEVLSEGREVAQSIKKFSEMLRACANQIPKTNPHFLTYQDQLIRGAQSLDNLSTQLRILTSVKAASVEKDKDTDATLNTIVQSVGAVIGEGLTTIDITRATILKPVRRS